MSTEELSMTYIEVRTRARETLRQIALAKDCDDVAFPTPAQAEMASRLPVLRRYARRLFWTLQSGLQRDLLSASM